MNTTEKIQHLKTRYNMKPFRIEKRLTDSKDIQKYFNDIRNCAMSKEEEYRIRAVMHTNEKHYRNLLIRGALLFVVSVAKHYASSRLPLADLISEGNIGLCEAAKRFNPSSPNRFTSYAVW